MRSFLVALAFLTVIPIRFLEPPDDATVARSRYWFPVVGLLLGALLGGWTLLLAQFTSPMIGAFIILAAWVLITGALHIDGFCDLCDGLFGGKTPEERLEIMKDPHVGTFGLVGGGLLLLGKFTALYELLNKLPAMTAFWVVAMAVFVARCLGIAMAGGARYPRAEGTGRIIVEAMTEQNAIAAVCFAAVVVVLAAQGGDDGLVIMYFFLPVGLVILILRRICDRRLGGITGDCLGAAIEIAELVLLLQIALPPYKPTAT
jgi:adenosylcobinamide-GDP ribazoletransferase